VTPAELIGVRPGDRRCADGHPSVDTEIRYGKRRITQRLIVQQPRLTGPFAAVAVRNFDAVGRGRTTIRIVDLRTGAAATSRRTALSGSARDWTITDLGVGTDGRAAWIARYRPDPSQSQVLIGRARGTPPSRDPPRGPGTSGAVH
jgi:hypothetical protein